MYLTDESNPLINEFDLYIIDRLHKFQNMQHYTVTPDTDIAEYVHECESLHDGTKIYRFSKELLAYLETCVAFSPYYLQNDPRTAGVMDVYYNSALQAYAGIPYEDLHAYLTRRLTGWYKKFPVSNKQGVVSMEEAAVGDVVMVDGAAGGPVPVRKPRYSMEVLDDDMPASSVSEPAAAPAAAASPAAGSPAAAEEANTMTT